MFIQFSVANYRSIGERQVLSFVPSPKQKEYEDNVFSAGKHQALNVLGIYGANASGKSNLLKALGQMRLMILNSVEKGPTVPLPYDPFLLKSDLRDQPTEFEIVFLLNDNRYRYGFEYSGSQIESEWLYRKGAGREVNLFYRIGEDIDISSAFKGNAVVLQAAIEATRPNALFLSFCAVFNIPEVVAIQKWLNKMFLINGSDTDNLGLFTAFMFDKSAQHKQLISSYLDKIKNIGLHQLEVVSKNIDTSELLRSASETMKTAIEHEFSDRTTLSFNAVHHIYDANGKPTAETISQPLKMFESDGTQKLIQLIGPVIQVLEKGGILVIDEMEAKMHPLLTLDLIKLFLSPESNANKAQLIFATHDTNLLTYAPLRRDQIYFTNKNRFESTEVYSLADFVYLSKHSTEKTRPDADKEKRYLEGRYQAVPVFNKVIFNFNGTETANQPQ